MTERFEEFKEALADLCLLHELALRTEGIVYVIDGNRSKGILMHSADFCDGTREQLFTPDH